MKSLLFVLLFMSLSAEAAEQSFGVLDAEFWFSPRHADVVLSNSKVGEAVRQLIADPDSYLALRYPATETGELWSQELTAWLVSLGVVSDRIELQSGFDTLEGVELVVIGTSLEDESPHQIDAGLPQSHDIDSATAGAMEPVETPAVQDSIQADTIAPDASSDITGIDIASESAAGEESREAEKSSSSEQIPDEQTQQAVEQE